MSFRFRYCSFTRPRPIPAQLSAGTDGALPGRHAQPSDRRPGLRELVRAGFRRSGASFTYRPYCGPAAPVCPCASSPRHSSPAAPSAGPGDGIARSRPGSLDLQNTAPEHYALYLRYQAQRRGGGMDQDSREQYRHFLLQSNVESRLIEFREDGTLRIVKHHRRARRWLVVRLHLLRSRYSRRKLRHFQHPVANRTVPPARSPISISATGSPKPQNGLQSQFPADGGPDPTAAGSRRALPSGSKKQMDRGGLIESQTRMLYPALRAAAVRARRRNRASPDPGGAESRAADSGPVGRACATTGVPSRAESWGSTSPNPVGSPRASTRTAHTSTLWPHWASASSKSAPSRPAPTAPPAPVPHVHRPRPSSTAWASTTPAWTGCWKTCGGPTIGHPRHQYRQEFRYPIERAADDYLACLRKVYALMQAT